MEEEKESSAKTLIDLNVHVLDKIYGKLKSDIDKINLAKTHPYLAEAFEYHAQVEYQEISVCGSKELFSFVTKNCGKHVKTVEILYSICKDMLQLIIDYCPNVNSLRVYFYPQPGLHGRIFTGPYADEISFDNDVLYKLINNFKSLRNLELLNNENIDREFFCTLVEILDENGVTPDDPLELVVYKYEQSLDDELLKKVYFLKNANLVKPQIIIV